MLKVRNLCLVVVVFCGMLPLGAVQHSYAADSNRSGWGNSLWVLIPSSYSWYNDLSSTQKPWCWLTGGVVAASVLGYLWYRSKWKPAVKPQNPKNPESGSPSKKAEQLLSPYSGLPFFGSNGGTAVGKSVALAASVELQERDYKNDEFLKKLYGEKLREFPLKQRHTFSKDADGVRWRNVVLECVESIADYFNLELVSLKEGETVADKQLMLFHNKPPYNYVGSGGYIGQDDDTSDMPWDDLFTNALRSNDINAVNQRLYDLTQAELLAQVKKAVKAYKIHLMPFKDDIPLILYRMIKYASENEQFRKALFSFKFCITSPQAQSGDEIIATIVIYAGGNGKEDAQRLLDALYELLRDGNGNPMQGLDIVPRWNRKVTSLIYWSQGHGGNKKNRKNRLYEYQDDRVCYKSFITGELEEYELVNPAHR